MKWGLLYINTTNVFKKYFHIKVERDFAAYKLNYYQIKGN